LKHPFDPRINAGVEQALWHADSNFEAVIVAAVETVRPGIWIETGTHCGWTSHWVASRWPELPLETVECSDHYIRIARENLGGLPNVTMHEGDSATWLPERIKSLPKNVLPLFWLDAHWYRPVPILRECAAVATLDRYLCIIDDFDFRTEPPFSGDGGEETFDYKMLNLEYVAPFLGPRCLRPNYPSREGFKGYGIFAKGVEFEHSLLKVEEL
jgi:hypothetical protein